MKLTDTNDNKVPRKQLGKVLSENKSPDILNWREELDDYYTQMQDFINDEPDEIFMRLSAFTSRVSFIRSQIMRSSSRMLQAFRTGEIDPFISECDRQFKFWSRVQSVYQTEASMTGKVT
jgi:hypothetical protein